MLRYIKKATKASSVTMKVADHPVVVEASPERSQRLLLVDLFCHSHVILTFDSTILQILMQLLQTDENPALKVTLKFCTRYRCHKVSGCEYLTIRRLMSFGVAGADVDATHAVLRLKLFARPVAFGKISDG